MFLIFLCASVSLCRRLLCNYFTPSKVKNAPALRCLLATKSYQILPLSTKNVQRTAFNMAEKADARSEPCDVPSAFCVAHRESKMRIRIKINLTSLPSSTIIHRAVICPGEILNFEPAERGGRFPGWSLIYALAGPAFGYQATLPVRRRASQTSAILAGGVILSWRRGYVRRTSWR